MGLLEDLRHLGLSPGSYVVVGSGILEVLGIRDTADIDLIVDDAGFRTLEKAGWEPEEERGKPVLRRGRFETSTTWTTPDGELTRSELAPHSVKVAGHLVIGLPFLLKWKKAMGRPKDLADISLIETYLKTSINPSESHDLGSH